jgi:hypothetical protein
MGWIPEYVDLTRNDFPVTYTPAVTTWPEGTERLAQLLDELAVDPELGRPAVRQALKEHGETARNETLSAAIKYRRDVTHQMDWITQAGTGHGTAVGQVPKTPGQGLGQSGVPIEGTPPSDKGLRLVEETPSDDMPEPF